MWCSGVVLLSLTGFAKAFTLGSSHFATHSLHRSYHLCPVLQCAAAGGLDGTQGPALKEGSAGVEEAIRYLNSEKARKLLNKMALSNAALEDEAQRMNFWTGGNFVVDRSTCTGIVQDGLQVRANCKVKDKDQTRDLLVPFPSDMLVDNEVMLKNALVAMATKLGRLQDTADIVDLPFGKDLSLPLDFKFNNVPHYGWVRAYMYEAAVQAGT
jgi:hypothetical protein